MKAWLSFVLTFVASVTCIAPARSQQPKKGALADVSAIGDRNVARGPNFYSLQREVDLGKKLAVEIDSSVRFIDDPVVAEYVNRIGQNLVRDSDAQFPFTIRVVDSDEINAYSLPGGFLYVNSGLMLFADEESALAGVMAHGIAHVCARHSTRVATKRTIALAVATPLILLGPGGWVAYAIYGGVHLAVPLTMLKFSRAAEMEADYLGTQYMYKAGYDPNAVVAFLEKLAADRRPTRKASRLFSTHPELRSRIQAVQREIATTLPGREEYVVTTSEFEQVRKHLLAMYDESHQGASDDSEKPTIHNRSDPNAHQR